MANKISFIKYQGAGNDFVLIDMRQSFIQLNGKDRQKICDRRFGIGADGILEILESSKADFKLIYYNADGRIGSLCGNGSRCSIAYFLEGTSSQSHVKFECIDKIYEGDIYNDNLYFMKMSDINFSDITVYDVCNFYVNNGSPHHVRYVTNVDEVQVIKDGHELCYGQYGQDGCNINFCEVLSAGSLRVRTYERGVDDETLACGTGATAVALISHYRLKASNSDVNRFSADVIMRGGTLNVTFSAKEAFENVKLIGPATKVFSGTYQTK